MALRNKRRQYRQKRRSLPSFHDTHLSRHEANHGALNERGWRKPFCVSAQVRPFPMGRSPFFLIAPPCRAAKLRADSNGSKHKRPVAAPSN